MKVSKEAVTQSAAIWSACETALVEGADGEAISRSLGYPTYHSFAKALKAKRPIAAWRREAYHACVADGFKNIDAVLRRHAQPYALKALGIEPIPDANPVKKGGAWGNVASAALLLREEITEATHGMPRALMADRMRLWLDTCDDILEVCNG